jgi:hypothetical protein
MSEPQAINLPEILAAHAQSLIDPTTGQRADLRGANLIGASLSRADLRGANLRGANLGRANLIGASLDGANLSRADLRGADLIGANLGRANLIGASLIGANLSRADLRGADLIGANLIGASLDGAVGLAIAADAPQRLRAAAAAALQEGALEMRAWHTCETTHCLGGWLIHQAGDMGRLLETAVGPSMAGLMLGGIEAHSHFHDENRAAAEWLRSVVERPAVEVAK